MSQNYQIKGEHYVLSQKDWGSKTVKSSPLSQELANSIRQKLLDKGYQFATVVFVATIMRVQGSN